MDYFSIGNTILIVALFIMVYVNMKRIDHLEKRLNNLKASDVERMV